MLPDGCGTSVLRRVRRAGLATRVCVITGCGPDRIREARAAGAEHVLTKPLDLDRLLAVLTTNATAGR
jgi:DNA-binding response OmpR family regulator